jgi:glycosyltransferase involved in cell wall biosynthesis
MKFKFTVFTPCYNSEKLIERVFKFLQEQTFKDFEWIVVDDNSPDNTVAVIENLLPKANFPIKFLRNEKNQMVNKNYHIALDAAEGELFIKLSHDDYLPKEALQNFHEVWQGLTPKQRTELYGVTMHCCDINNKLEGTEYPFSPWIADDYQMRFQYKVQGEKCSAQRTELMKEFPFHHPEIDTYVPADLHFYSLNNKYKSVYANKIGMAHIVGEEKHVYLEKQIGRGQKYTKGMAYWYENMTNHLGDKVWQYSKYHYILFVINFIRYSRYDKQTYLDIQKKIKKRKWLFYPSFVVANLVEIIKYKTIL